MFNMIKKWLKNPWVYDKEEGVKFIDSINPLDAVIEHPEYPMARIYREGFWVGMKDTFNVLVGSHYSDGYFKRTRIGVLDGLLFPMISRKLLYLVRFDPDIPKMIKVPMILIAALLEVVRFALGFALTAALSPIVALVHGATYSKAQTLKAFAFWITRGKNIKPCLYTAEGERPMRRFDSCKPYQFPPTELGPTSIMAVVVSDQSYPKFTMDCRRPFLAFDVYDDKNSYPLVPEYIEGIRACVELNTSNIIKKLKDIEYRLKIVKPDEFMYSDCGVDCGKFSAFSDVQRMFKKGPRMSKLEQVLSQGPVYTPH